MIVEDLIFPFKAKVQNYAFFDIGQPPPSKKMIEILVL